MSDIFINTESQITSESYDDGDYSELYDNGDDDYPSESYGRYSTELYNYNCPPGHYISIQAGGRGHSYGDSCGCDELNPQASIDFIVPLLILTVIILIFKKIKTVV